MRTPFARLFGMALLLLVSGALPSNADRGLQLKAAFFTASVDSKNAPGSPLSVFDLRQLSANRLWFYSEIGCEGGCRRSNRSVRLTHKWFTQVGSDWILVDRVPHDMTRLPASGAGYRFPSHKARASLDRTHYRVIVTEPTGELCLDDRTTCEFTIEVR